MCHFETHGTYEMYIWVFFPFWSAQCEVVFFMFTGNFADCFSNRTKYEKTWFSHSHLARVQCAVTSNFRENRKDASNHRHLTVLFALFCEKEVCWRSLLYPGETRQVLKKQKLWKEKKKWLNKLICYPISKKIRVNTWTHKGLFFSLQRSIYTFLSNISQ